MNEEEDDPRGIAAAVRNRMPVIIGMVALLAWFAMLWAMFGDVL